MAGEAPPTTPEAQPVPPGSGARRPGAAAVPARVTVLLAVLALLVGPLLAGCGPSSAGTVRVGSADDPESRLLGEIYATGLQVRGVSVERHLGVVPPGTAVPRLLDGTVDVVPQYTGALLHDLDPAATVTAPDTVDARARAALPPGLRLLRRSEAQHKDAVVVTRAYATAGDLRTLDDLAPRCGRIVLGGPPAFALRPDGVPGLARLYGCTPAGFRPLEGGGPATVAALRDGTVAAADLATTDPAVASADLVVLDDPRSMVTAQNVVPLTRAATSADPGVVGVLDRISAQLDTQVLADLNRRLAGPDAPDTAEVARDWLTAAGIG